MSKPCEDCVRMKHSDKSKCEFKDNCDWLNYYNQGITGAINDLKEIASIICREYEPFTKTDDAQVNARAYGHIDCAHKIVQMMEQLKEQSSK